MDVLLSQFNVGHEALLMAALMSLRGAIVFIILPIFSQELVPAMVRNSLFMVLGILCFNIYEPDISAGTALWIWGLLFLKEVLVGLVIGLFFGLFLWAFDTAGRIIDTQVGLSMAQIYNSLSGEQTTLLGDFISHFAIAVFVIYGGLSLLLVSIIKSFSIWPVEHFYPVINSSNLPLFTSVFSNYFSLAFLLAAPIIVICLSIDVVMGLVNRYTPQFNVFFLSSSLKFYTAIFLLLLLLPAFSEKLAVILVENIDRVARVLSLFYEPKAI